MILAGKELMTKWIKIWRHRSGKSEGRTLDTDMFLRKLGGVPTFLS